MAENTITHWSLYVIAVSFFLIYIYIYFYLSIEGEDELNCTRTINAWEPGFQNNCPGKDWTVLAIAGLYLMLTNLLLVNLVVAMFR